MRIALNKEDTKPLDVLICDGVQEGFMDVPDMLLGTHLNAKDGIIYGASTIVIDGYQPIKNCYFNGKQLYKNKEQDDNRM